jgi:regulator of replication initiation timing
MFNGGSIMEKTLTDIILTHSLLANIVNLEECIAKKDEGINVLEEEISNLKTRVESLLEQNKHLEQERFNLSVQIDKLNASAVATAKDENILDKYNALLEEVEDLRGANRKLNLILDSPVFDDVFGITDNGDKVVRNLSFVRVLNQQAEMSALCADMEGMKAANAERLANNESLAYPESEFECVATSLRNVANALYQLGHR